MFPVIKQLEERNVANEINILLWSHRMDLIAYSNVKGQYNNNKIHIYYNSLLLLSLKEAYG